MGREEGDIISEKENSNLLYFIAGVSLHYIILAVLGWLGIWHL